MKTVLRVFAYLKRYPVLGLKILGYAIAGTVMLMVLPWLTRLMINEVVNAHHPEHLLPFVLGAALVALLQNYLNYRRLLIHNTFDQEVIFDLRRELYSRIQLLPLRWFDNHATGDLMTRIVEDVTRVESMLIDGVEQGMVAVLQILITVAFMFHFSAKLTLFGLAPVPLLVVGAVWCTRIAHRRNQLERRAESDMSSLLQDNLAGIRQTESFVRESDQHLRFNEVSDNFRRAKLAEMKVWAVYSSSMYSIGSLGVLLTVAVGTLNILSGAITPGDFGAFLVLIGFLYEPVGKLHEMYKPVQRGRAAGERIFEIIDEPAESQRGRKFNKKVHGI